MIRSKFSKVALAAASVVLVATACVPPSPGPVASGSTWVCAPADTPVARVEISVVDAPSGGWVRVVVRHDLLHGSDSGSSENDFADVTAGGTYSTPDFHNLSYARSLLDPGLCLWVGAADGVTYRVTAYPETDPLTLFLYAIGNLPQYFTNGSPRA